MSKTITIRFHRVIKNTQNVSPFGEALNSIWEKELDKKFFKDREENCNYFLHYLTKNSNIFEGEFVRMDEDPDVTTFKENELRKLIEDNLSASAVFLYDAENEVLVLQGSFLSSRVSVLERLKKYMNNFYRNHYDFKPLSKGKLDERIGRSEFKQLDLSIDTMSIAHTSFSEYSDLSEIKKNLGAGTVKMSYTLGRKKDTLDSDAIKNLIYRIIDAAGIGIQRAKIKFVEDKQMVDLFKDYILFESKSIDLPSDPTHSREARITLLKEVMHDHSKKLIKMTSDD